MRIISGIYKGRRLKSPSGNKTRPTSDRLRETIFNILGPGISDEDRFLDLCAGTGAIGAEALSRGCGEAVFVDISRRSCALIEENLDLLGVPEDVTTVERMTAEKFVLSTHFGSFDLIYYDPPYKEDYSNVLAELGKHTNSILAEDGTLCVEHHFKTVIPDEIERLRRWRIVKQGDVFLSLFEAS